MSETKVNATLFSKFKKTQINSVQKLPDLTGLTLGEFHTDSRLDIVSGEADIYLCSGIGSLSGKKFLLKYYRRENALKQDVLDKLKTVTSPFVAPVAGYGVYQGHQYAVRPYYEMSALSELLSEGTRFSEEELRTFIIPSVIEGLKAVHDAGILHKDLKPANLIPDDAGEHIVLIDFGISSHAGKNTFVVTQTGMTPCYAAPEALQGIFHKETDYYAFGITIFELFTGFTPFQNPELSPEAAARLAAISKIEFPENFPEDLKKLVQGLTYKDISHRNEKGNPNRRWGYNEVRRWLQGEDVPVPGESEDVARPRKFLPYSFGGVKHQTLESLVKAMLKDPASGIREIGRGILTHHLGLFAPKLEKICREAEECIQKNSDAVSAHQVFYRLMYRLAPELKTVFCGGQEFGSLKELGEAAISNAVSGNTGFASSLRLLQSSFLYFYAKAILKNDTAAYILWNANDLITLLQCTGEQCTDVQVSWILGYALSDRRNLRIDDREFSNIAELWEYLMKLEIEQGESGYIKYLWDHRQDLEFFVAATPKSKCVAEEKYVQALKVLLEELDSMAVFGECEFQFRHFWEFDDYAEKLLSEKQTGRLSKILNIYGLALKEVSEKVWQSDSYENLRRIVSGFAVFEGQLFASVPDFEAYLKEHRDNPELFKKYLKTENSVLTDAEINTLRHRVLHKVSVNSCYRPYDSDETETPKAITVNGIRYPAPLRVKAGEYIKFGRYPHTERYILTKDKKDKEPIEWLVLEVNGNEALLVSRYALDCCPYNDDWMGEITWEECFLRRFLNIEFLTRAFSGEEMRRIKLSEVVNDNNPDFGVSGGNNTRDRIFCLSLTEARCYFKNIAERQCQVTEYARCQGAWTMNDGYGMWWLRSPSSSQEAAAFVLKDGSLSLDSNGYGMFRTKVAVRPALRLIWNL